MNSPPDPGLADVVADLLLAVRVDAGDVRALELEERLAEAEVDARGLDLGVEVVEGIDDEVARLEAGEDVAVGEYHAR